MMNSPPVHPAAAVLAPLHATHAPTSLSHFWLFSSAGPIAASELHSLGFDFSVLLGIVVLPALAILAWTALRYRARSARAASWYRPQFSHSLKVEMLVWGVPVLVVMGLGLFSYYTTHAVNPYDPRVLHSAAAAPPGKPLLVDVVATDWQWLFIYPRQHIAVANQLVLPVDRRVDFRLTSTAVMNSFFIPQVVGQIYAMPGMRTRQATLVERAGTYHGLSAEFSGGGFSWMRYHVHCVAPQAFAQWVRRVSRQSPTLDWRSFVAFARPTINLAQKPEWFAHVTPGLFDTVVHQVRAGNLRDATPLALTENMHAAVFVAHSN